MLVQKAESAAAGRQHMVIWQQQIWASCINSPSLAQLAGTDVQHSLRRELAAMAQVQNDCLAAVTRALNTDPRGSED